MQASIVVENKVRTDIGRDRFSDWDAKKKAANPKYLKCVISRNGNRDWALGKARI